MEPSISTPLVSGFLCPELDLSPTCYWMSIIALEGWQPKPSARGTEALSREFLPEPHPSNIPREEERWLGQGSQHAAGLILLSSSPGHQAGLWPQRHAVPWLASVLPVAGK